MANMTLKELARHAAHRTAPTEFSVASVDAAFADEIKKLTSSINEFMRNKYDIFAIVTENADEIVPAKVMAAMSQFAETIVLKNGETKMFKRGGLGRNRAKKFLTQAGLSGVYESFRLDAETFTIQMKAIGGAVSIDFQRMLDGAETLAEFMDVLVEAQEDAIYAEVQKALMAAANNSRMPAANKLEITGAFDGDAFQKKVNVVKAYAGSAVIFAAPEFIDFMGVDAIIPATANVAGVYNPKAIEDIANTGRIKFFRGTPIVELKQSFLDENNNVLMINPNYAYILPAGKEKIVKVLMEGQSQIWDMPNRDQSIEINTYRMVGVGILTYNDWAIAYRTGAAEDKSELADASLGLGVNLHV